MHVKNTFNFVVADLAFCMHACIITIEVGAAVCKNRLITALTLSNI